MIRTSLLIFLLLISSTSWAKQLVLIQGYLAKPMSWTNSGITQRLSDDGWVYGGNFDYGSDGVQLLSPALKTNSDDQDDRFYQVHLPTETAIQNQAFYLNAYLKYIRQNFPDQPIILVGHSAGGVLARYVMVRNPRLNIKVLITIASPHLGTDTAEIGQLLTDSPLSLVTPMIGAGRINRSQGLYQDLLPEMPNRFLYWLNRQPHPEAEYYSIVRDPQSPVFGDLIVPANSQYMENVQSLKFRANSYVVEGTHQLNSADADLVIDLIDEKVLRSI